MDIGSIELLSVAVLLRNKINTVYITYSSKSFGDILLSEVREHVRNEQTDILNSGHFSLELEGNSLICFLFITIKVFQFFYIYTINDGN